jgi:hypothetical protein
MHPLGELDDTYSVACGGSQDVSAPLKVHGELVTKYLREHPEERHYTAQSDVLAALAEAFPCKRP